MRVRCGHATFACPRTSSQIARNKDLNLRDPGKVPWSLPQLHPSYRVNWLICPPMTSVLGHCEARTESGLLCFGSSSWTWGLFSGESLLYFFPFGVFSLLHGSLRHTALTHCLSATPPKAKGDGASGGVRTAILRRKTVSRTQMARLVSK